MSLNKNKTNSKLGREVNSYLKKKKVSTPVIKKKISVDSIEKKKIIEKKFSEIMDTLGLDLRDDSLTETPRRIAKMFVDELYWGLIETNFPKCTTVENKMKYSEMIVINDIKVASDCEHHFRTIWGHATIAYFPKKKVLGLSKFNRIVEYFARRPQIQERLTEQIYFALEYILETKDIAVIISADHFCVKQRGVEDSNSYTTTSKMGGKFQKDLNSRQELMNLLKK